MNRFQRFGFEHAATLALLVAVAILLSWFLRRSGPDSARAKAVRIGLAGFLAGGLAFALVDALPLRGLDFLDILPLHFCDLAVLLAILALLTRQQAVSELLYFWGLSGTVIAMLTPDVDRGFPDTRCLSFFALHGAVAMSAAIVAFGLRVRPRPGAHIRAFWITNAYAVVAALINAATGTNYMYLREKPSQPSILDVMGPWPWYILAADVLAFLIFWTLMLPFRGQARLTRQP